MKNLLHSWAFWALLSAGFAALTAIFAKIGIENVNPDFATFIRTMVILLVAALIVYSSGNGEQPSSLSAKTWLFLILSGAATGASWICYFRALKHRGCRACCSDLQAQRRLRVGFRGYSSWVNGLRCQIGSA
jgi:bacterial/archaeal transporter family protein